MVYRIYPPSALLDVIAVSWSPARVKIVTKQPSSPDITAAIGTRPR